MKSEWLTASGFEMASEILLAVNTMSIDAKLKLSKSENPTPASEVAQARRRVVKFVHDLQSLIDQKETDPFQIVARADPRLSDLASQYMLERSKVPARSILFSLPMSRIEELIQSEDESNLKDQIACLATLRTLVEQGAQMDISDIFDGE